MKRCACSCCLKVNKHWRHLPIASHTTKQSLLFFVYFIFLVTPPYPPRVCSLGAEHLLMKEIRLRKKQLIILQNRYKHFLFTEKSLIYKKQKWKLMQCTTKEWPGVKMFYSLFINNPPPSNFSSILYSKCISHVQLGHFQRLGSKVVSTTCVWLCQLVLIF